MLELTLASSNSVFLANQNPEHTWNLSSSTLMWNAGVFVGILSTMSNASAAKKCLMTLLFFRFRKNIGTSSIEFPHLLVHCYNGCKFWVWVWTKCKPEIGNFIQVFCDSGRHPRKPRTSAAAFLSILIRSCIRNGATRIQTVPLYAASAPCRGLTWFITVLALGNFWQGVHCATLSCPIQAIRHVSQETALRSPIANFTTRFTTWPGSPQGERKYFLFIFIALRYKDEGFNHNICCDD